MSIGAMFVQDPTETSELPVTMTVEEFMAIPDDGVDRELIRGELREYCDDQKEYGITIRNRWHCEIEITLGYFLVAWLRQQPEPRARIFSGEAGFRLGGTKNRWSISTSPLSRRNCWPRRPQKKPFSMVPHW